MQSSSRSILKHIDIEMDVTLYIHVLEIMALENTLILDISFCALEQNT